MLRKSHCNVCSLFFILLSPFLSFFFCLFKVSIYETGSISLSLDNRQTLIFIYKYISNWVIFNMRFKYTFNSNVHKISSVCQLDFS